MEEPEFVIEGRMAYFGPWGDRLPPILIEAEEIAVPTGQTCPHCQEPFAEDDLGMRFIGGYTVHRECNIRATIGSVGHQLRACSCHGGDYDDPPGMSRRDAATLATMIFDRFGVAAL